nr:MAG TPA: hypothetical protein [Caudoviricetes sp.]
MFRHPRSPTRYPASLPQTAHRQSDWLDNCERP